MSTIHRRFVAGALGLAVLVPAGMAAADTDPPGDPVCTAEQRTERWAARDQLRTQIQDQLREEGVTDPDEVRDQLRIRLHEAMELQFGELDGPHAGAPSGDRGGPGGTGGRHLGPMDGTGRGHGATG